MGFSRQEYWSGVPLPSPSYTAREIKGDITLQSLSRVYSLWPHGLQHVRLPCLSLPPGVCSNSRSLSQWCYLTISSSAALFSFGFNLSQHQGLFQWVDSSRQVARVSTLKTERLKLNTEYPANSPLSRCPVYRCITKHNRVHSGILFTTFSACKHP